MGHVCLPAFGEEAAFEGDGRWEDVVGLAEVSGRWVKSRSWSVILNVLYLSWCTCRDSLLHNI